jgi:glucokinase
VAFAIGVDIGGTKIAAGLVAEDGTLHANLREPTPEQPLALQQAVADVVGSLASQTDVVAVGIAVAGFVSTDRSTVVSAPNLALEDVALGAWLRERLGLPVWVENDANAAAWGEHRFGAGRGRDLVCVTVGTGVGGGIVVDGQLVRGHWGFAAEVGHIPLVPDGLPCPCGSRGCWEQYGSGTALVRYAKERAAADPEAAQALLAGVGGDPDQITGDHVTAAARAGDRVALSCFEEVGGWAGRGLAVLAAVLDPPMFVLGGGVSDAGPLLIEPTARMLAGLHPTGMGAALGDVCAAELGNEAGLVGAADLARP